MPPVIIWAIAASYSLFFITSFIAWKRQSIDLIGENNQVNSLENISIKNLAGITLLSLPLFLFHANWSHWLEWPLIVPWQKLLVIAIMILVFFIALHNAIKKARQLSFSEGCNHNVQLFRIINYLLIRITFLVVYECFFRGLFLSVCAHELGSIWAIIVNLSLYTGIHTFNSRSEILASIPFGIVLCVITLRWQSIVPAIMLHLVLAITYEAYLLISFIPSPKIIKS